VMGEGLLTEPSPPRSGGFCRKMFNISKEQRICCHAKQNSSLGLYKSQEMEHNKFISLQGVTDVPATDLE
jgi:hypothetical protein